MAPSCQQARGGFSREARARREAMATMDHSDIRGLVTALHRYVAGLPLSKERRSSQGCPRRTFEDSPHRIRASRSRSGAFVMVRRVPPFVWTLESIESGPHGDVSCQIPDEAGKFSSDGGANLVFRQTACVQAPVALAQAQLCPPSDLALVSRLSFVADLQIAGDPCAEAVRPSRLDQHATGVRVAGLGDRTQRARVTGGAFARHESEKSHELLG